MSDERDPRTGSQTGPYFRSHRWYGRPAPDFHPQRHSPFQATYAIMIVCVLVWVLQKTIPQFNNDVTLDTVSWLFQPWRLITSAFAHSVYGIMHIAGNMLTLLVLGRLLEPALGKRDYLMSYILSALGGSAVFVFMSALAHVNSAVVGASAAVFGLFGILIALSRQLGTDHRGVWALVAINLLFGFIVPGIAWQAHIGGFLTGLACGWMIGRARRAGHATAPAMLLVLVPIGLILLATRMLILA